MRDKIFLTSAAYIKEVTNISDNVNDKVMYAAIREAQDINLRGILGDCLLNKLKQLVSDDTIKEDENFWYADLLDEAQYFLAYSVITKICFITTFKIDNIGLSKTTDERVESLSTEDALLIQDHYQKKADYYAMLLQKYILRNKEHFPELSACDCNNIHANLYSAASGGIFLGGARGKIKNCKHV